MLDELKNLDNLLNEIRLLKQRSDLLDKILTHYNVEEMNFEVPKAWKSKNVRPDKLPAKSPRHLLYQQITDALTEEEKLNNGFFNKYDFY